MYEVLCVTKAMFLFFKFILDTLYLWLALLPLPTSLSGERIGVLQVTWVYLFQSVLLWLLSFCLIRTVLQFQQAEEGRAHVGLFHMAWSCWLHAFVSNVR